MSLLKRNKKKVKQLLSVVTLITLTMGALTGCGGTSDTAEAKKQLNVSGEILSDTLDPAVNWDSWFVMRYGAAETLVKFADDGSYQPWLAESWECADDNLTWTIKLKDGVKFSNGEPMTATKVVESIERLYEMEDPKNGGTGNPQGYFTYESLKADDEKGTVTIVTTEETPDLPGCLAYPWTTIIDVEGSKDRDIKAEGPICTGPYAISEVSQGQSMKLTKNEHYWDGEVPFETVNVMQVKEPSTRTMSLQDKSADVALSISASDRKKLESEGGYNISVVAGSRVGYTHMNLKGALGNDDLRKAVVTAIDSKTIADVTTDGSYTYGYSVIPSNLDYGYDKLKNPYSYDPEKAKKILDDAKIVDTDGDGYRELDGKNVEINYVTTKSRQGDVISQAQASQLEAIGIKCKVNNLDSISDIYNNGQFDMIISNEVTVPTGDPAKFLKHWYSKSDDNYSSYKNEKYDAIYEKLEGEFDTAKRKEYIVELQQILLEDVPAVVTGYYNYNLVSTDAVEGAYCSTADFYWITKDIKPTKAK